MGSSEQNINYIRIEKLALIFVKNDQLLIEKSFIKILFIVQCPVTILGWW
jgi:hypothetical protein